MLSFGFLHNIWKLVCVVLVPTLQRGNAYPGAPAPRNKPLERMSRVTPLERGNQKNHRM